MAGGGIDQRSSLLSNNPAYDTAGADVVDLTVVIAAFSRVKT
jgi:hypothetical protein